MPLMYVCFYLVPAIIFLLFDIETVFLFPWAASLSQLPAIGYWSLIDFLFEFIMGFVQMTLSRVIDKMVVDEGRALQPCRYRWCSRLVLFSTHTAHNRAVGTHT